MSYILDALSKSQRERERATVPTLTTVFPVKEPKRYPPKALIGATIGVLTVGVVLAIFGLSGRTLGPQMSRHAVVASAQPSPMTTTTKPSSTLATERNARNSLSNLDVEALSPRLAPDKRPPPQQTASQPAPKEPAKNDGEMPMKRSDVAEDTRVASAPDSSGGVLSDRQLSPATRWLIKEMSALEQDVRPAAINKQESPVPASTAGAVSVATAAAGTREHRQPPMAERDEEIHGRGVTSGTEPSAQPTDEIPALGDLPPELRSTIPALKLNVHTYAQTREKRMVLINMKRYGEGDRLAEGPLIEAITPDGVVLVHEQRRFHLPTR